MGLFPFGQKEWTPAGPLWADCESSSSDSDLCCISFRREHDAGVNFEPAMDRPPIEDTQVLKGLLMHSAGACEPRTHSMQKKCHLDKKDCTFCPCEEQTVVLNEAEKEQAGEGVASRLQAAGEEVGPRRAQAQAHGLLLTTLRCKWPRGTDELPPASTKRLESHIAGTCKPCSFSQRGKCRFTTEECTFCHLEGHQWKRRPSRRQRQERRHRQSLLVEQQEGELSE